MGIEYMFFEEALRDSFVQFVADRGVESQVRPDEIEGFVVELPEELDDEILEAIDAEYETLMDEQMTLAEAREGWFTSQVAGITVTLADGSSCVVRLPGPIARRLLEHFDAEEVHEIVTAIARSVESPIDGPLCQKEERQD